MSDVVVEVLPAAVVVVEVAPAAVLTVEVVPASVLEVELIGVGLTGSPGPPFTDDEVDGGPP